MYISASMIIETGEARHVVSEQVHFPSKRGKKNYSVEVDRLKFLTLLEEYGMSGLTLGKIQISIKEGERRDRIGEYSLTDKNVRLWPTQDLKSLESNIALAESLSQRRWKLPWDRFSDLYTTKLPEYLTVAPAGRGLKFAERLFLRAAQREINSTLLHEGKHAIDMEDESYISSHIIFGAAVSFIALSAFTLSALATLIHASNVAGFVLGSLGVWSSIGVGSYLVNYRSPLEKRAYKFSKELKNHPEWGSMVKIIPLQ